MAEEGQKKEDHLRFTCVTLVTVADNLSVTVVLVTRSSKVASTVGTVWTRAWTTLTTAQNWVTIVTIGTPTEGMKSKHEWETCEQSVLSQRMLNHN